MEKSSFFNSVNGDRKYKAGDFAEFFNSLVTNGIFPNPSTNLQVISNNDMTVTIKAGKAWINGYVYINDSDLILNVDVADGVLSRVDRLVLRMDTVGRAINAVVKKGTFASSPVAPTLQRNADGYELGIADIYVGKGVVSIAQANITDLRLNTVYCGIVNSLIQVDTTTLFNQYVDWYNTKQAEYNAALETFTVDKQNEINSWFYDTKYTSQSDIDAMESQFQSDFDNWFITVKDTLSGDIAGNLLNMINANTDAISVKASQEDLDTVSQIVASHTTELAQKMNKQIQDDTTTDKYEFGFMNGELYYRKVIE